MQNKLLKLAYLLERLPMTAQERNEANAIIQEVANRLQQLEKNDNPKV